jgi:hypothetical protein
LVEKVAVTLIPVIYFPQTEFGKLIQFEYETTLDFILRSFSLYGTKKVRPGSPTPLMVRCF